MGPLRIAVLECDTPLDSIRGRYGGYGRIFKALLEAGAINDPRLSVQPNHGLEITKFDVVGTEQYPNLDDIDAVLLTGSKYNAFDNDPWIVKLVEFTRRVLEEQDRVRVIGVCFGHQIVGRALGMKVDRSFAGWEISVTNMELTEKGMEIFKVNGKQMVSCTGRGLDHSSPAADECGRVCIRCTETSSSNTLTTPKSSLPLRAAMYRECTRRTDTLRFKDIPSSTKTSSLRSLVTVTMLAYSTT